MRYFFVKILTMERLLNSEGIETADLLYIVFLLFESSVNSEGIETTDSVKTEKPKV